MSDFSGYVSVCSAGERVCFQERISFELDLSQDNADILAEIKAKAKKAITQTYPSLAGTIFGITFTESVITCGGRYCKVNVCDEAQVKKQLWDEKVLVKKDFLGGARFDLLCNKTRRQV